MAIEYKLSYTASQIDAKLDKIDSLASKRELPTKTSDLINDNDFTTKSYVQEYAQPIGDYALQSDLEGKSDVDHMHSIDSIDGLQEAVGAAADSKFYVVTFDQGSDGEYHADLTFAQIREKFEAGGNMVARIDGTDYIPLLSAASHQIIFSGIYQATSVSLTINPSDVCTLSSNSLARSQHSHSAATKTNSGFMRKDDKAKLDGIDAGAEVNVIESISVNGEALPVTDKSVNIVVTEPAQPDWNQNDETAIDYIKNKPCYDNTEVMLDTITVNNGDTLDFAVSSLGNTGDIVSVIWDGVSTNKTIGYCEVKSGNWNLPYNTIGNQSYIADTFTDGGDDTGEDYVIYSGTGDSVTTSTVVCDDQPHTLSIVKGALVQIDEKYIPETIARKSYVDEKIDDAIANIPAVTDAEIKMPIELAAFHYFKWENLYGSTIEEKAQQLARYGIIVYQGELSGNLVMSGDAYQDQLELYTKALEYNPNLKVFGYVTTRGFANSTAGGQVGMTEYRTSPANVDHPIWTKEELAAYINLMAHCGGTKDTSATDEFGNPVLSGGIPLYGVFFDDYDYNFEDDNTHLMNQGDWTSIREKHNFLIDYAHSCGLHVMPNSNPSLIFDNTATPNSIRNPDGITSHMCEDDWFCVESYFLRSDNTFGINDKYVTDYNEKYRDAYKSKCLVLSYTNMVSDDAEDNKEIASTYVVYQALCQGADAIALHDTTLFTEIPAEFAKYYDKNGNAVRRYETDTYTLNVNGYEIIAKRSEIDTAYGRVPNASALATLSVTVNGRTFNNMYPRTEEIGKNFTTLRDDITKEVESLSEKVEQSSNLYQRAFIDDWKQNYTLADYTNHCFTFQNAFGGEDTGATSTWNEALPYNFMVFLPKNWSWRRVTMDARHLAGKTVELGFETSDAYLYNSNATKIDAVVWQVVGVCESNSNLAITTFKARSTQKSIIDGVERCCVRFTMPEDIQELMFWTQRTSANPDGTWVIKAQGSYLVDIAEHTTHTKKTWFTNYAPSAESWGVSGSNSQITYGDDKVTVNYTATTNCYETSMKFPTNTTIFKSGETWELGFKDLKLIQPSTGLDVTSKLVISFNLSTLAPNLIIYNKTHSDYLNMKSEAGDGLIAITRFTVPEDYTGGMSETPLYIYPNNYAGGDDNGLYELHVEGLYLYKLDERDELFIRGEDLSDTYIGINRVRTDTIDEELKPDSLYIVDDGSMFATNFKGERVDLCGVYTQLIMRSSTEGSSKKFRITIDDDGTLTPTEIVD